MIFQNDLTLIAHALRDLASRHRENSRPGDDYLLTQAERADDLAPLFENADQFGGQLFQLSEVEASKPPAALLTIRPAEGDRTVTRPSGEKLDPADYAEIVGW